MNWTLFLHVETWKVEQVFLLFTLCAECSQDHFFPDSAHVNPCLFNMMQNISINIYISRNQFYLFKS